MDISTPMTLITILRISHSSLGFVLGDSMINDCYDQSPRGVGVIHS